MKWFVCNKHVHHGACRLPMTFQLSYPSFYNCLGSHHVGWLNDGKDSLFSGITGLAVTPDGSSLYISDYNNSAIRQFMPYYNKMVDFAIGIYQHGSEAIFDPNIVQPTYLEIYNLALFAVVKHDTGSPEILSINIYTRR